MKCAKHCLCYLLLVMTTLFVGPVAYAHTHTGDLKANPRISTWAVEEISRAKELGLIPISDNELPADYTQPITRGQFRRIAMEFLALQENCDIESLSELVELYLGEKGEYNALKNPFDDGDTEDAIAYYLGVIKGYGDGRFDPDGFITRQEAAVMLARAYEVCGGTLPIVNTQNVFADEDEISDWAKDSVLTLASWNVIRGMEDGTFDPQGQYSVEQCILTFLRLYENAPVSRKNGNNVQIFSYEQCLGLIDKKTKNTLNRGWGFYEVERVDAPVAMFVRLDYGGVMLGRSSLYFIYHNGGIRQVDIGICKYPVDGGFLTSSFETTNCRFSEDGQCFYCLVEIKKDVVNMESGEIAHEAGIYSIEVNVQSLQYTYQREP